ncbi:MAG: BMC domain-containing protein [Clostridia bacterium]
MVVTALGMIETIGLVSAIEAADAGLKAADVRLLGTDYVRGGLVMVRFEGEVAAVQAAVDVGADAARRVGHVFSAHVIPRAMPEVFCMLAADVNEGPAKLHGGGCAQCGGCEGGRRECEALRRLEAQSGSGGSAPAKPSTQPIVVSAANTVDLALCEGLKVVQLRQMVRKLPGFSMSTNEIRYANKRQLLDALAAWKVKMETV